MCITCGMKESHTLGGKELYEIFIVCEDIVCNQNVTISVNCIDV